MKKINSKEFKNYYISKLLDAMVVFVMDKVVLNIVIYPEGVIFVGIVYYRNG